MRKHNRILHCVFWAFMWAFGACESFDGERRLVPAARLSVLIPSQWETTDAEGIPLELQPRGSKSVKLRVIVDPNPVQSLEDLVTQEMREAAALEKKTGAHLSDVTRIEVKRSNVKGARLVFQMTVPPKQKGGDPLELSQIEDLLLIGSTGVGILALGPKQELDKVAGEIDTILASVRTITPEPEIPRATPPDAVTSASQRATQNAWR